MKTYSYTLLPTIKTYDGDNILFYKEVIADFLKKTHYERISQLNDEEKCEFFEMSLKYREVLDKVFDNKIVEFRNNWTYDPTYRNPTEEYETYISLPKDEDLTDYEHELKVQHLKEFKDWYEKQQ